MHDDDICTIVIRRRPGERREVVVVEIREGEDLIVTRAIETIRRQMLGYASTPSDPPTTIETVSLEPIG